MPLDAIPSDLFAEDRQKIALDPGAWLLGGFALNEARGLLDAIAAITDAAPFRHLETPGGRRMSVAMTNCGSLGWSSDRRGYRYTTLDPLSGKRWPPMSLLLRDLALRAAASVGFSAFMPDACLINRYQPGARLTLHQDRDEDDLRAPIVSVSLGASATFLWGGPTRAERAVRHRVHHGDVVVWGGPSRMNFHGVDALKSEGHPLTGDLRFNLTFRQVRIQA